MRGKQPLFGLSFLTAGEKLAGCMELTAPQILIEKRKFLIRETGWQDTLLHQLGATGGTVGTTPGLEGVAFKEDPVSDPLSSSSDLR